MLQGALLTVVGIEMERDIAWFGKPVGSAYRHALRMTGDGVELTLEDLAQSHVEGFTLGNRIEAAIRIIPEEEYQSRLGEIRSAAASAQRPGATISSVHDIGAAVTEGLGNTRHSRVGGVVSERDVQFLLSLAAEGVRRMEAHATKIPPSAARGLLDQKVSEIRNRLKGLHEANPAPAE